ncbi:signal peptidase I [Pediococcus pentosaceus]|nr:signal peptidase I [Pediococcus pentosaceus]AVL02263.1 signal peptidase I [Pediococcus pentosaceus]MBF7134202.1 signal peptidase I [Pediococcus pentosaceus]QPT36388.1 signal peptidase I [Pediococcus pentosaceus]QYY86681.1 signal peptidase I [Pediococcus pentosaceus]
MRFLRDWILPIVIGLLVALLVKTFLFQFVKVDGSSMQPNLQDSERVLVWKPMEVKRMSVIVFDAHGEDPAATEPVDYVKRVIGVPGDTISYKDGKLYVNDKLVPQKFIDEEQRTTGTGNWTLASIANKYGWAKSPKKVPKDSYFVLGDHRSVSNDSRYWGFVKKSKVMGVVKVPFWSKNDQAKKNINKLATDQAKKAVR